MSQLGERLRAAREGQGISLAQAAIETRILQRYLIALEDSDYQHLPGDVYARGFLRNYAEFLQLPSEELIELYRRERGTTDPIRVVPATTSPRIRGFFVPSFFGVFFVVLALIGVTYLGLNITNRLTPGETPVALQPTSSVPTPSPLPSPVPGTPPSSLIALATTPPTPPGHVEAAGGGITSVPASTPTPDAPIVGVIQITPGDNPGSWMRVNVDGQSIFEGVLKAGMARPFRAQRNILIRVGNAGVVSVVVNGQKFSPLGANGQVIDFPWPPQ